MSDVEDPSVNDDPHSDIDSLMTWENPSENGHRIQNSQCSIISEIEW